MQFKLLRNFHHGLLILRLSFLTLLCIVCYFNASHCGFVFDDFSAIIQNQDLRSNEISILDLFTHDFWGTPLDREESHKSYRPLTVLTYRLQFSVHGLDARPFHVANVLLHCLVSVAYFILVETIVWRTLAEQDEKRAEIAFSASGTDQRGKSVILFSSIAFTASVIFAAHPIHTEAVTGVVGRAELLAALFFIIGLITHIRFNDRFEISLLVVLCASVATFCKEQGVTVLASCCIWDLVMLDRSDMLLQNRKLPLFWIILHQLKRRAFWRRISALISGAIAILAVRLWMLKGALPTFAAADNPASASPFPMRHLTYAHIWSLNSLLLLCPQSLCADWSMGMVSMVSVGDVRNLGTIFFLCCCSFVSVQCLRSNSGSTRLLFYAWFALTIIPFLPASNLFFPVGFVIAERVLYIPSLGYCLLIASGYCRLLEIDIRSGNAITDQSLIAKSASRFSIRRFAKAAFCVTVASFCLKCIMRNLDWRDDYSLFTSALRVSTKNAKSFNNIGHVLEKRGEFISALEYFIQASRVDADDIGSWINVGRVRSTLGHAPEAEAALKRALSLLPKVGSRGRLPNNARVAPHHLNVFINLGNLYKNQSRLTEAEVLYRRAIATRHDFVSAYMNLGDLLMATDRIAEALDVFRKALEFDQIKADLWYNVGIALMRLNRSDEALANFDHALSLNGDHFYSLVNSALLLSETSAGDAAKKRLSLKRLEKAVFIRPKDPESAQLLVHIGNLQYEEKLLDKAQRSFEHALELDRTSRIAALNLAIVRADMGNLIGAISILESALEVHPDFAKGWLTLCGFYTAKQRHAVGDTMARLSGNGEKDDGLKKAHECYEKVLSLERNNAQARHNLCITLISLGEKARADKCIKEARRIATESGTVYTVEYVRILDEKFRKAFLVS